MFYEVKILPWLVPTLFWPLCTRAHKGLLKIGLLLEGFLIRKCLIYLPKANVCSSELDQMGGVCAFLFPPP